jgi:hypothetical protein
LRRRKNCTTPATIAPITAILSSFLKKPPFFSVVSVSVASSAMEFALLPSEAGGWRLHPAFTLIFPGVGPA